MTIAIEAQNLRKSFRGREAVRGVDLSIRKGELFALLGPNGAGKSTTIHMLTTLLRPDAGSARVCGWDVSNSPDEVRKRIGATGQFAALDEALTGRQNLVLFAGLYGYSSKAARMTAAELLAEFGLTEAADRTVDTYSGGMRRRLDLAAGILSQPEALFLDEPTTGLDPKSRHELWEAVRRLAQQGTTVLLTTQYLEEADRLADRIGFIADGRIVAIDTPERLKSLVGGKTLTIRLAEGSDPGSVCSLLAVERGLTVQPCGECQTLKLSIPEASLAHSVIATLLQHSAAVVDFALGEPSLDDVYFALTSGRCKEATL
ncbi:ATP-binding cassette domain-containing protein [Cohnella sp. LGH]|uniref:ATP-binding cassette domain-containing protein n=1 Tax=Cohnella sp. LGH TaxID=1619153 RepID=UPI001ADB8C5E|nr:ATP-binding cassette domain-containing protein [Cohnella sp. LGH]QTH46226.1 ATP-binding cassette domain-containing protein [Cohnella sp. LGH]